MTPSNARKYLETQISTASSEQLLLMLYDGVLRFLSQAREAMEKDDIVNSHEYLIRSQRIVIELLCSLKRDIDPHLTDNLTSLYYYIYQQLIKANVERDVAKIDEAIKLLDILRSAWREAVQTLKGQQKPTGTTPHIPAPSSGSPGISLRG